MNPWRRYDPPRRDLDAIRREMRKAVVRDSAARPARLTTRRRLRLVVATLGSLVVCVAGTAAASAVLFGTTGIPSVDRLISAQQARHSKSRGGQPFPPRRAGSRAFGLQQQAGSTSRSLPMPSAAGGAAEGVAYLSNAGDVCFATYEDTPRTATSRRPGTLSCWPSPREIASKLLDTPAVIAGSTTGHPATVVGYAAEDVDRLKITTPDGHHMQARLSEPWTPSESGADAMRIFVASGTTRPEVSERERADGRVVPPDRYGITALLEDGRTWKVR